MNTTNTSTRIWTVSELSKQEEEKSEEDQWLCTGSLLVNRLGQPASESFFRLLRETDGRGGSGG
jgi:hypothetical protein